MSWEYRLAHKVVDGVVLYGLVEVYYDGDTTAVNGFTDFIDPNGWDNVEDLRFTLEKMLAALDKPMFERLIEDVE